jgi:gliding motility-associated-like protein
MKFLVCLWLCVLINSASIGQVNLVPNPSFENVSTCPNNPGQLLFANGWYSTTPSTPDLFNACCSISPYWVDVPQSAVGWQYARTGEGYAGIGTSPLDTNVSTGNVREYISTRLLDSLQAGQKYCAEFYVSLADSSIWAVDQIGAVFTVNDPYDSSVIFDVLPLSPQVESPFGVIINDTSAWVKIEGSFIATGGEEYIVIGIFRRYLELSIDTLHFGSWAWAYYYIDDVSVYACPDEISFLNIPTGFSPNGDDVNDVFAASDTNLSFYSCKIYNRWGNLVFESNPSLKTWNGQYQGGNCVEGTYYYIIEAVGVDDKKYFKKGFLTLVR